MNTTGQGISAAGANAAQQALGLQGNLAGNLALLQNQAQQQKNQLYGRAFDMLGRGIQPGSGMPTTGVSPMGGMPNVAGGSSNLLGNLGLGGVGNAFGNGLSSIGSGLGSMFGSPGSSIWGTGSTGTVPFLQNSGMDSINLAGEFGLAGF
jgi:hypothetical protein